MILVIAGNYHQYVNWRHYHPEIPDSACTYADTPAALFGYDKPHILLTGTWRDDHYEVVQRAFDLVQAGRATFL